MKKSVSFLLFAGICCLINSCSFAGGNNGTSLAGEAWCQKVKAPDEMKLGYVFLDDQRVELMQGKTSLGIATYSVSGFIVTVKHSCGTDRLFKIGPRLLTFINGFPIQFERRK